MIGTHAFSFRIVTAPEMRVWARFGGIGFLEMRVVCGNSVGLSLLHWVHVTDVTITLEAVCAKEQEYSKWPLGEPKSSLFRSGKSLRGGFGVELG